MVNKRGFIFLSSIFFLFVNVADTLFVMQRFDSAGQQISQSCLNKPGMFLQKIRWDGKAIGEHGFKQNALLEQAIKFKDGVAT